jgi:hypothetical protein
MAAMSSADRPAFPPITRSERSERAKALLREPDFVARAMDEVSEGLTLYQVAQQHDIPYRLLYDHVVGDSDRNSAYEMAVEARNAMINDRVLSGILGVAGADVRAILDDSGDIKSISKLSDAAAATVSAIDISTDERGNKTKKVRMHDKMRAFEMLGKNQSMFTDKVRHEGVIKLEDLVAESMVK